MSTPTAPGVAPPGPATGPADKLRIRFHKGGPLRWLSHHDLMRGLERMLRRAELPFRQTQGFHPHPRIVFALSLPLGVVGRAEVVEIEMDAALPAEQTLEKLRLQCPPGLELLSLASVPVRGSAQVRSLSYAIELPADRADAARAKATEIIASASCWVERKRPAAREQARRIDLRPFLRDLRVSGEPAWLEMDLWLKPEGTARPDEVLAALGLADLAEGGVIHRTRLELHDEVCPANT